jgi:hypothetical protein
MSGKRDYEMRRGLLFIIFGFSGLLLDSVLQDGTEQALWTWIQDVSPTVQIAVELRKTDRKSVV